MTDRPRLVAERQLDRVPGRMATAAAGRRLAHDAERHLQAGMPQLAVFAFDHVGRAVAQWGRYEREELELLMQAALPLLKPGGVCLDIGANVGNHALFFSDHFAEVLAFEPHPRTQDLLRFNAQLRSNVRCFDFGLSDANGQATLTTPAGNAGMATLHGGSQGGGGAVAVCQLRRLDDVAEANARPVALIKVDVEGHEAAVLRGGRALLARERPLVVFEQTAAGVQNGESDVTALLRSLGYSRWWTFEQRPQTPWRALTLARRLLGGEQLRIVETPRLAARFHSMVVALPA